MQEARWSLPWQINSWISFQGTFRCRNPAFNPLFTTKPLQPRRDIVRARPFTPPNQAKKNEKYDNYIKSTSTQKKKHHLHEWEWRPTLALTATKVLPTKWNAGCLECCFPPPCSNSTHEAGRERNCRRDFGLCGKFEYQITIRFSCHKRLPVWLCSGCPMLNRIDSIAAHATHRYPSRKLGNDKSLIVSLSLLCITMHCSLDWWWSQPTPTDLKSCI